VVIAWREPPGDKQVKEPLGPVRVTIDDLAALLAIVTEVTGCARPRVEFGADAGFFTAAQDIRHIPKEMRVRLVISTPELTVELTNKSTEACGSWEHVVAIKERWARPRRTSRGPGYVKSEQKQKQRKRLSWQHWIGLAASIIGFLSALGYLCFQIALTFHPPTSDTPVYLQLSLINLHILRVGPYVTLPLSILWLLYTLRIRRVARLRGWARVIPVTLEQFKSRPDRSGLLQFSPIVLSALTLAGSTIFSILKLGKPGL
jgi:hypothetical protein